MKILVVIGTRPEVIKTVPLVLKLREIEGIETLLCSTGQHKEVMQQALEIFEVEPDFDLDIMKPNQSLSELTANILLGLQNIIASHKPDLIIGQGDTSTSFATILAGFYEKVKVVHIEAGLRTGDIYSPFPEEMTRRVTAMISNINFAPTQRAKDNLINEGIPLENIVLSGNTGVDALFYIKNKIDVDEDLSRKLASQFSYLDPTKRLIIVTCHRRENHGIGLENICNALKDLIHDQNVQIIFPVHHNPNVKEYINSELSNIDHLFLVDQIDYLSFIYLLTKSYLIITDSGGIQEEAPSLGIPVLVTRHSTERQESVDIGSSILVGPVYENIIREATQLLEDNTYYKSKTTISHPFGDGNACNRIIEAILKLK